MNKGICHVNGDWINILNSGDYYVHTNSLELAITGIDTEKVDVVYGDSIEINDDHDIHIEASSNYTKMNYLPIYRHGSSLIKTNLQKHFLYNLNKGSLLAFSLDWEMIHRVFKAGYVFYKVDIEIEAYKKKGESNRKYHSIWYNYIITSNGKFSISKSLYFIKTLLITYIANTLFYKWTKAFFLEYVINDILPHIPFWTCRRIILKLLRVKIGRKSFIMKRTYIMTPNHLSIGNYSDINRGCLIDARGGITIGDNVSISHNVNLITGGHNICSPAFKGKYLPITIGDYVWIGVGCTILNNVRIGKGAVVCAGAVVTKDVEDYAVVAGIPAKKIKERTKNLCYHCIWDSPFT